MEVRLHASLHTKGLTGVSHLTLAYMMGWTYVRSVGRSVGRSYDDVITKISRMDGLPYFLSNGAPRARAFGARGAPLKPLLLGLYLPSTLTLATLTWLITPLCLGVKIDNKLAWSVHIDSVKKSFTQKVGALKRMRILPKKVLEEIYFKTIIPSVTYGISVWGKLFSFCTELSKPYSCKSSSFCE